MVICGTTVAAMWVADARPLDLPRSARMTWSPWWPPVGQAVVTTGTRLIDWGLRTATSWPENGHWLDSLRFVGRGVTAEWPHRGHARDQLRARGHEMGQR